MQQRLVLCAAAVADQVLVVLAARIDARFTRQLPLRRVRVPDRIRGNSGRRNMVKKAVVLVIVQDQNRATPDLGVGGERLQHTRRVVRTLRRTGLGRMLRVPFTGNDPADLGQRIGQHIGLELLEVAGAAGARPELFRRTGRTGISIPKDLEKRQRVVVVVVVKGLVNLPADAGCLQAFRVGGPGVAVAPVLRRQRGDVVEGGRPRALRVRIIGAGPQEQPVRRRATLERTVVRVTQREGVCQCVMERNVGAAEVAHGMRPFGLRPLVQLAVGPGLLGIRPGMGRTLATHQGKVGLRIQMKGLYRTAALDRNGKAVSESAHAAATAEIVVKRAVLLGQHHDVRNVLQTAGALVGIDRQCLANCRRQG